MRSSALKTKATARKEHLDSVSITYKVDSGLGLWCEARLHQHITGFIFNHPDQEFDHPEQKIPQEIGRIDAYRILASEVPGKEFGLFEVADFTSAGMEVAEQVYDLQHCSFNEAILSHYDDRIRNPNLLVLAKIEVLPEYRGKEIGKYAIKDLCNHFLQGCGLLGINCYPHQFIAGMLESEDPWHVAMKYQDLPRDVTQAKRALRKYFISIGFEPIPGVDLDTLVINPLMPTMAFTKIDLDKY